MLGCGLAGATLAAEKIVPPTKTPPAPPPVRVHYHYRNTVRHHPAPHPTAAAPKPEAVAPVLVPVDPAELERARAAYEAALAAVAAATDARMKKDLVGIDERVVEFLKTQTEAGSIYAPFDLAAHYRQGKGIGADPQQADRLTQLAADRGNEDAARWLREHPVRNSESH